MMYYIVRGSVRIKRRKNVLQASIRFWLNAYELHANSLQRRDKSDVSRQMNYNCIKNPTPQHYDMNMWYMNMNFVRHTDSYAIKWMNSIRKALKNTPIRKYALISIFDTRRLTFPFPDVSYIGYRINNNKWIQKKNAGPIVSLYCLRTKRRDDHVKMTPWNDIDRIYCQIRISECWFDW